MSNDYHAQREACERLVGVYLAIEYDQPVDSVLRSASVQQSHRRYPVAITDRERHLWRTTVGTKLALLGREQEILLESARILRDVLELKAAAALVGAVLGSPSRSKAINSDVREQLRNGVDIGKAAVEILTRKRNGLRNRGHYHHVVGEFFGACTATYELREYLFRRLVESIRPGTRSRRDLLRVIFNEVEAEPDASPTPDSEAGASD